MSVRSKFASNIKFKNVGSTFESQEELVHTIQIDELICREGNRKRIKEIHNSQYHWARKSWRFFIGGINLHCKFNLES